VPVVCKEPVEKWRNVGGHNLLELMYQAGKLFHLTENYLHRKSFSE
jgi:hypothetical protein